MLAGEGRGPSMAFHYFKDYYLNNNNKFVPLVTVRQVTAPTNKAPRGPVATRDVLYASPDCSDEENGDEGDWTLEDEGEIIDITDDHRPPQQCHRRRRRRRSSADLASRHRGSVDSAASSTPSLSPSRPRLFDDEDDDDDDGDVSDDDDEADGDMPTTPSSRGSSLSRSASSRRKSSSAKPTSTDPLLSPPPFTPILARTGVGSRRWLPGHATVERRLSASSSLSIVDSDLPSSQLSAPPPASISLLTQSLRSLVKLPNLSLADESTPPAPRQLGLTGLDLDRLVDESPWDWRDGKPAIAGTVVEWDPPTNASAGPDFVVNVTNRQLLRRPPSVKDNEHATAVQLQTFSIPATTTTTTTTTASSSLTPPPSPPRSTIELPDVQDLPVTGQEDDTDPASPSSAPPSPAPVARYISNQRHLLMLSLELSMMKANKLKQPLRPRAVVVRQQPAPVADEFARVEVGLGSGLRWEVIC